MINLPHFHCIVTDLINAIAVTIIIAYPAFMYLNKLNPPPQSHIHLHNHQPTVLPEYFLQPLPYQYVAIHAIVQCKSDKNDDKDDN